MALTIEKPRVDERERTEPMDRAAKVALREVGGLGEAPCPASGCDCREALRRLLTARDRFLAALGDGSAPFTLPEEDEYLDALASARKLVSSG